MYLFQGLAVSFAQIVAIPLHHLPPLRQVFRAVVCRPNLVLLDMGKLPLYRVAVEALFVNMSVARLRKPCGVAMPL